MIIIREMQKRDANNVLSMMQVFYNSPAVLTSASDNILKKDISDCIDKTNPFIECFVFEYNNIIAGYSMIAKSYSTEYGGTCIWIEDLYIKPKYRSHGIGTQFFEYIEKKCHTSVVRLRLEVELDNKKAINVYKKCGYKELPYIQMTKEF